MIPSGMEVKMKEQMKEKARQNIKNGGDDEVAIVERVKETHEEKPSASSPASPAASGGTPAPSEPPTASPAQPAPAVSPAPATPVAQPAKSVASAVQQPATVTPPPAPVAPPAPKPDYTELRKEIMDGVQNMLNSFMDQQKKVNADLNKQVSEIVDGVKSNVKEMQELQERRRQEYEQKLQEVERSVKARREKEPDDGPDEEPDDDVPETTPDAEPADGDFEPDTPDDLVPDDEKDAEPADSDDEGDGDGEEGDGEEKEAPKETSPKAQKPADKPVIVQKENGEPVDVAFISSDEARVAVDRLRSMSGGLKQTQYMIDKTNDELKVSLEQVRVENQNLMDIALRMEKIMSNFNDIQASSLEMSDKVGRVVGYARDTFQKEYAEALSSSAMSACSQFINESRKRYEFLFDQAVKNFKQFSEAAIAWQKEVESKSNMKLERVSMISLATPVLLLIMIGLQLYILFGKP